MYKVLRADKDTYIADRVIKSVRTYDANFGAAGSLNLFKLYGVTMSSSLPNTELSRILIHYDLQPLRDLINEGLIDISNGSFNCSVKLFDVYGGQPTPSNFTAVLHPLSRSFDEGLGKDVVYHADRDVSNFLSGSRSGGAWLLSGCSAGGGLPGTVDYITASTSILSGVDLESSQLFLTGEENLEIDVTLIVSATLAGLLPDEGFRIALDSSHETDLRTYFVKRFGGRTAFNEAKRPKLVVKFDDSIQDDSTSLYLDSPSKIFLRNYVHDAPANLTSGSGFTEITGSNSLILKLATEISGGWYTLEYSGSQHANGIIPITGIYSASVNLSSTDSTLVSKMTQSGSVKLIPIWGSIDGTVTFLTGSELTIFAAQRSGLSLETKRFTTSVHNVNEKYFSDENSTMRIHLFDITSPHLIASRLPIESPGRVIRDVHYQVRDVQSNEIEIPFDTSYNSTRCSSDALGMYFDLDMSNLISERTYVIDIMLVTSNKRKIYKSASPEFRVTDFS